MTEFNEQELKKLSQIVYDKYAIGGFSGMIFNAKTDNPEVPVDVLIKRALDVRLRIEELGGKTDNNK